MADGDVTLRRSGADDLPVDPDVPPSDRDLDPVGALPITLPTTPEGGPTPAAVRVTAQRPRGRARLEHVSRRVRRVARHRWDVLAAIAAGGAAGSLGRWGLTLLLPSRTDSFPWATFTANVAGCLLLGVLMVLVIEVWPPSRYLRPFLGVGVLGGFTTFSTYMLDARGLLLAGRTSLAGQYVIGSLAAGLVAVWVGILATRLLIRSRVRRRRQPARTDRSARARPSRTGSASAVTRSRR
jgi:fluoride exporter